MPVGYIRAWRTGSCLETPIGNTHKEADVPVGHIREVEVPIGNIRKCKSKVEVACR